MEPELVDGEFWLPPEFLNDVDFSTGKPNSSLLNMNMNNPSFYSFGSYGPNSNLNSPVESVISSTETESDEEDYLLNGLNSKFASTTLHEQLWKLDANYSKVSFTSLFRAFLSPNLIIYANLGVYCF